MTCPLTQGALLEGAGRVVQTPAGPVLCSGMRCATPAARVPPEAEVLAPVVADEHRARGAVAPEQCRRKLLLVGPRVGVDDAEVLRPQPELLVRAPRLRPEPRMGAGPAGRPAGRGDEAAVGERGVQAEVGGEPAGRLDQCALGLDPVG